MDSMLNMSVPAGSVWSCETMTKEYLLNTGSTIEEGRLAKGGRKLTEDYMNECAVCEMNPDDHAAIGSPGRSG